MVNVQLLHQKLRCRLEAMAGLKTACGQTDGDYDTVFIYSFANFSLWRGQVSDIPYF
jgi:hypothetical protein